MLVSAATRTVLLVRCVPATAAPQWTLQDSGLALSDVALLPEASLEVVLQVGATTIQHEG